MRLPLTHHTYANLARIADQFLTKHNSKGAIPVPIEEIIEFDFKIHVVPLPGMHELFEIDGFTAQDLSQIIVDETVFLKRPNRFRFTLAHELAHVVLHKAIYRELAFADINSWKMLVKNVNEQDYAWLEWQADALAGLILVPQGDLAKKTAQAIREVKKIALDLRDRGQNEVAKSYVASQLGKGYEVSVAVVEKRLGYDRLWPEPAGT